MNVCASWGGVDLRRAPRVCAFFPLRWAMAGEQTGVHAIRMCDQCHGVYNPVDESFVPSETITFRDAEQQAAIQCILSDVYKQSEHDVEEAFYSTMMLGSSGVTPFAHTWMTLRGVHTKLPNVVHVPFGEEDDVLSIFEDDIDDLLDDLLEWLLE